MVVDFTKKLLRDIDIVQIRGDFYEIGMHFMGHDSDYIVIENINIPNNTFRLRGISPHPVLGKLLDEDGILEVSRFDSVKELVRQEFLSTISDLLCKSNYSTQEVMDSFSLAMIRLVQQS